MKTFSQFIVESDCVQYSDQQIKDLEKFADHLLNKFDIDIEFTKHFGDRLSDSRNTPCISIAELQQLFKKITKDKGKKIKEERENVLIDIQKSLNLPFVASVDGEGEFLIKFKTVMRKSDFKTSNTKITY